MGMAEDRMCVIRGGLAEPIPRAKGSQIRVGYKPEKISQLGNVQLPISISVSHLEFSFEKAQQLSLGYSAFVVVADDLS